MKVILFVVTLVVASLSSSADPDAVEPDGTAILQSVVAGLPAQRLNIAGDMLVRRRHGVAVRALKFDMTLDWGAAPPSAEYTIRDAFGSALERFAISRPVLQDAEIRFETGVDLVRTNPPPAFASVQNTDFTWTDLALSFLWWKGGRRVGHEEIKGRDCYLVDVPVPDRLRSEDARYDHVRLWVDKEIRMLLRAEGRDLDGNPLRRMWVHSFKKIDDRWMIKDMEVQTFPSEQRTKLTIREVREAEQILA